MSDGGLSTLEQIFERNSLGGLPSETVKIRTQKIILGDREHDNVDLELHYDRHGDDFFTFRHVEESQEAWFDAAFLGADTVRIYIENVKEPIKCLVRSFKTKLNGEIEIMFSPTFSPLELVLSEKCRRFECQTLDGPDISGRPQPVSFKVDGFQVSVFELPETSKIGKKKIEFKRETFPTARMVIEVLDGTSQPVATFRKMLRDLLDFLRWFDRDVRELDMAEVSLKMGKSLIIC
jgi:hypothetical protein